ncbi:phosphoenolpyruvate--protein phosphotransferase [Gordonia effusa NBRC 100432]|uniref:Phosphoenolpyruvate-protein phosphotransferase n=1 Tax=Gordonia effusa NBRC 100432 TaxID=1077974 RepID=H0QYQ0_9ACTN|nr:phosphoenolpyruvate--protein phosphotransferase [Gordonia effusa]GAB17951.1 phosphoenolpyruvate--protein phosphotransferase [Gordonia effusa NBRC 100432]
MPDATAQLTGTPVVSGIAYGPVIWPGARPEFVPSSVELVDAERAREVDRFSAAAADVAAKLRARASASTGVAAEVLSATAGLAEDRGWLSAAGKLINSGSPAADAAVAATKQFADLFTKLGGLMAERVTDLNDVRDRVLAVLLGSPEPGVPVPDSPSVLFADDLAPADTAGLDPTLVIALVTRLGGPTSHTAIIARQLGIPCIVAVDDLASVATGTPVLIDGTDGTIDVEPPPDAARAAAATWQKEADLVAAWAGPGRTADGLDIAVLANVADGPSARAASSKPVAGIGLFRTELAFLDRATAPTVDEQAASYREVFDAFGDRKVVIRTLDAGSDKPMKFVTSPQEANPALGVRGNRIATAQPELRETQLDAIAAAAAGSGADVWVMAPMIATVAEAAEFAARARERGLTAGVMIEVPAAALLASAILAEVDFVSIGTNDLTQYTMAADRMSAELATLTDPWQPAVLSLVSTVAAAGRAVGKPVGVCGEAAADPLLACVLVGMGVTSLSSAPVAAAAVGARLGQVTMASCEAAARAALATTDPASARAAAAQALAG